MRCLLAALICAFTLPAAAQQPDRRIQALPFVVEDRNNALDGLALCKGDVAAAQQQVAELKKQLDEANAEISRLRKSKETQ